MALAWVWPGDSYTSGGGGGVEIVHLQESVSQWAFHNSNQIRARFVHDSQADGIYNNNSKGFSNKDSLRYLSDKAINFFFSRFLSELIVGDVLLY